MSRRIDGVITCSLRHRAKRHLQTLPSEFGSTYDAGIINPRDRSCGKNIRIR
jgi:hypothetical protein